MRDSENLSPSPEDNQIIGSTVPIHEISNWPLVGQLDFSLPIAIISAGTTDMFKSSLPIMTAGTEFNKVIDYQNAKLSKILPFMTMPSIDAKIILKGLEESILKPLEDNYSPEIKESMEKAQEEALNAILDILKETMEKISKILEDTYSPEFKEALKKMIVEKRKEENK